MKTKEIENLESYFKTENVHWNGFTFEMLCEVLKQANFENPETPLKLFDKAVNIFIEQHEKPLKAVQEFATETDKLKLTPAQRLFVYEWLNRYLGGTEFEELDLTELKELLKSQTERQKLELLKIEYNKPLTGNIRQTLKEILEKELAQLPDSLKEIETVQRLNIICKLVPYVLPKVESVNHTLGEPSKWQVP